MDPGDESPRSVEVDRHGPRMLFGVENGDVGGCLGPEGGWKWKVHLGHDSRSDVHLDYLDDRRHVHSRGGPTSHLG